MSAASPEAVPTAGPLGHLRQIVSRRSGAIGLALVAAHVVLALASPYVVPHDYKQISSAMMLKPPSAAHWLGTDHIGRDVLTRTMLGGREALFVTVLATPIAVIWGAFVGILLGLVGGRADALVMRVVDALLSLPKILFVLTAVAILGAGSAVLIPMLAFFYGIPMIRVARAATHDVVARDYVTAARARGHGALAIIHHELLPNVRDAILVEGAMRWSWMLLTFSSLSFLGFGVAPPMPDWGLMIKDASPMMSLAPWAVLAPIAALSSLIIGINLTADAVAKSLGVDRAQKAPV